MRNFEEDIASSQAKLFVEDAFLGSKLNSNFLFLRHPPFKFPIGFHFHFLYPSDILPFLFLSSWVVALPSIIPLQLFTILVFVLQEFEFAFPSSLCIIIHSVTSLLKLNKLTNSPSMSSPVQMRASIIYRLLPVTHTEPDCRVTTQEQS